MTYSVEMIACRPDLLGESPVWNARTGKLFWVDSIAPRIRSFDPSTGRFEEWTTPSAVGSIGLHHDNGHLIAALTDGFYDINLATGAAQLLARPLKGDAKARFNDGRMDRSGRFLSGTMVPHGHSELGKLYRLNPDLSVEQLDGGVHISNTLCFSPAGDILYFSDTLNRAIWAYDYDDASGHVSGKRVLIETASLQSGTDGATVDSDGCLWVALVEVGQLARITPKGQIDRLLDLPVEYPSCPAFGGAGLDTLYVTSIKESGSGRLVGKLPDSGKVLIIDNLGVTGLPEPHFSRSVPQIQNETKEKGHSHAR